MKLSRSIRNAGSLLKETALSWAGNKTPRLGAALAYYTVFAITPLFLVALTIAGLCFGEEAARRELFGQISALVGPEGGEAIQSIIAAAAKKPGTGFLAGALAVITLFVGASGVFIELQDALNTIWNVKRKPGRGWRRFIMDRLLSFGMIVGVGFLLLVSLILSAGVTALGKYLSDAFPAEGLFWQVSNFMLSLAMITCLFAMILKILPDVRIAWRDVWLGAFLTAWLFNLGKFLLGFYLARSTVASAYGAAGSLVIVLIWVYYSTQILFFGAEFTRVYAERYGSRLTPVKGAQLIVTREVKLPHPARTK
jgi:membrane protein